MDRMLFLDPNPPDPPVHPVHVCCDNTPGNDERFQREPLDEVEEGFPSCHQAWSDVYTAGAIANATKAVLVQERAFHAQYVAATQGLWDQAMATKVSTAQETKSKQAELEAEVEQLRSQADKDQVAIAAGQFALAAEAKQKVAYELKLDAYLQAASQHLKAELDKLQASHACASWSCSVPGKDPQDCDRITARMSPFWLWGRSRRV